MPSDEPSLRFRLRACGSQPSSRGCCVAPETACTKRSRQHSAAREVRPGSRQAHSSGHFISVLVSVGGSGAGPRETDACCALSHSHARTCIRVVLIHAWPALRGVASAKQLARCSAGCRGLCPHPCPRPDAPAGLEAPGYTAATAGNVCSIHRQSALLAAAVAAALTISSAAGALLGMWQHDGIEPVTAATAANAGHPLPSNCSMRHALNWGRCQPEPNISYADCTSKLTQRSAADVVNLGQTAVRSSRVGELSVNRVRGHSAARSEAAGRASRVVHLEGRIAPAERAELAERRGREHGGRGACNMIGGGQPVALVAEAGEQVGRLGLVADLKPVEVGRAQLACRGKRIHCTCGSHSVAQ